MALNYKCKEIASLADIQILTAKVFTYYFAIPITVAGQDKERLGVKSIRIAYVRDYTIE